MLLQPSVKTRDPEDPRTAAAVVDVVVPVYNEENQITSSVRRLRSYLDAQFPFPAVVTIVDNGSTDQTLAIARRLCSDTPGVRVMSLDKKGRGRALRAAWSTSDAEVVVYTDVDLSTSLDALLPLVAPLISGHSDLAIGSRLARGAHVVRGAKRELISRTYNVILRAALRNNFSDAQCGFKAARTEVVRRLLPLVDDESWFFDTELLVLAERSGLRIHEVPVDWVDDPDSRVNIAKTATDDLLGVARLLLHRKSLTSGEPREPRQTERLEKAMRFCRVGVVSTICYLALFLALRTALGNLGANTFSLVICTIANLTAHLWLTTVDTATRSAGLLIGGVAGLVTSLILTSVSLGISGWIAGDGWFPSVAAVLLATCVAGVIRFAVFRSLVFKASTESPNQLIRIDTGDD
ncbi:MAG: bifunctional glycosyltransferase family 2/GtrA family protein [Acidimicrobiales bacterium]